MANVGVRPDGTFAALDASPLFEWGKAAGSVYQEELRGRLTERLGVEWGPDRHGCREMAGFDPVWLRSFSKRTVAIEEHLAGAGPEHPDPATRMRADEAASLATRPGKDGSLTPDRLREWWQGEADEIGLPTGLALEAAVCGRTISALRPGVAWADLVDALVDPEDGLCSRRARFGEAQVVERVAALGAGRLDVAAIEAATAAFLDSGHAVRLVDRPGRSPQFSTPDHLALEGWVLDHLDELVARPTGGFPPELVERAIVGEEPGLGADQATAVGGLCGPGPGLRCLIAPAGFGKTTTVHAAAVAAAAAGHPVVGLAATNQAAGELRQAGVEAMTIARFALGGAALPAGVVVIVDEVSQVATAAAEIVLGAVVATPDARLWCLGDPHQAQAVRAGGLGAELDRLGREGRIPAPALTVNRRQLDPTERRALAHYRRGHVAVSQAIRRREGWEHDCGSPHATREALADAVAADIAGHGPAAVVALAVSHADCEDLADRIRARLQAAGRVGGVELAGPAWGHGQRGYAAGDRILVHGTLRTGRQRLHNGTVLTVVAAGPEGLAAVGDRHHPAVTLPRSFVEGRRADGSPNLSHAWARTVDGIQGGTWPQVHLLGTAALERYTGYTAQSRGRRPTHTWNVTRLPDIDHGGVLADQRTPDQEVLHALGRLPATGFAVHDQPDRIRALLAERAEHHALLAGRPPRRSGDLHAAERRLADAHQRHYDAAGRLDRARTDLDQLGRLSRLRRRGRDERVVLGHRVDRFHGDLVHAEQTVVSAAADLDQARTAVAAENSWDTRHGWRSRRVAAIDAELAGLQPGGHHPDPGPPNWSRLGDRHPPALLGRRTDIPTLGTTRAADRSAQRIDPRLPGRGASPGIDIGL